MKRRNPLRMRATRLLAYEKRKTARVSSPALLRGRARKDSAVCVSLSSKSQCQIAVGREADYLTPEPPMEANPPSGVNNSWMSLGKTRANSASVRKDRAAASNTPGDASTPARLFYLRLGPPLVKRWARQNLSSRLSQALWLSRPHSCPIAPPLSNR